MPVGGRIGWVLGSGVIGFDFLKGVIGSGWHKPLTFGPFAAHVVCALTASHPAFCPPGTAGFLMPSLFR